MKCNAENKKMREIEKEREFVYEIENALKIEKSKRKLMKGGT